MIPDVLLMGENIIIFSNKTFQVLKIQKIHITESYIIKYITKFLINTLNHVKNLQDLSGQNPC